MEKMTLGEFVGGLSGFSPRWTRTAMFGSALRRLAEEQGVDLATPCEVEFRKSELGQGPNSFTRYTWEVQGVVITPGTSQDGKKSTGDWVVAHRLTPQKGGFSVWYDYV